MAMRGHGAGALLLVLMMLGTVQAPCGAVGDDRADGSRGPAPMADEPVWTDSLDDMSHVYVPEEGLVNVEVSGGEVRLLPGMDEGWIASSVITCPPGYRYDLVYLEASLPGASQVQISVLNASKESSEIGFANETIPPHAMANGTDQSVSDISPWSHPRIRIQVNLVASGADRPRLLAWSLYYTGLEEWHDDFLGTGKMTRHRGLNITGGSMELNTTYPGEGVVTDFQPYPALAFPLNGNINLLYPDAGHTGYQDWTSLSENTCSNAIFDDLNGDGVMDLVTMNSGTRVRI